MGSGGADNGRKERNPTFTARRDTMLFTALYATSSGIQAASSYLDVVSNNIANSSTTGFKTSQITFQDLLYVGQRPGALTAQGALTPTGEQIGVGTGVDATTGLFTQGSLEQTGQQLDIAVNGQGFFGVTLPDSTIGYTRAGDFNIDATGQILSSEGFPLVDNIFIPANATAVSIAANGTVTATTPTGPLVIGNITLTQFVNPGGLVRIGNTTFVPSPSSGALTTGVPGTTGLGTLSQGFLERSNVELANELVNLLIAQRTFSFNTQALQVEQNVVDATTALIT